MMTEEIRHAAQVHNHLNALTAYVINDWPSTRAEAKEEIQLFWPLCDNVALIDGIVMKGRRILI